MNRFAMILVGILAIAAPLTAQEADTVQLGVRGTVVTAGGVPANDIISSGVMARFRLSDQWLLGGAVDRAEYDFEVPARVLGLRAPAGTEPVDAIATATSGSIWLERELSVPGARWAFFMSGGAGAAFPDVADVGGPLDGGGVYDLTTDAETEILLLAAAGVRWNMARYLALEFSLRADHHFSEWKVRDRVSGRTGATGDYTALGAHFGITLRF